MRKTGAKAEQQAHLNSCGSRALPEELAGDTGSSCKGDCQVSLLEGPIDSSVACWSEVLPAAVCACTAAAVA